MLQRGLMEEERRDRLYFREFYPEPFRLVQDKIETECDKLEYEGSILFDEYPDKNSLLRLLNRIMEKDDGPVSKDMAEIMLLQEIMRRRVRWRRFKRQNRM